MARETDAVELRAGYTVNMGNFESTRVDVGIVKRVSDGEDHKVVLEECAKFVEDALRDKMQEVLKLRSKLDNEG